MCLLRRLLAIVSLRAQGMLIRGIAGVHDSFALHPAGADSADAKRQDGPAEFAAAWEGHGGGYGIRRSTKQCGAEIVLSLDRGARRSAGKRGG